MIRQPNNMISFWILELLYSIKLVVRAANGKKENNNKSLDLFEESKNTNTLISNESNNFLNEAWMFNGLFAVANNMGTQKNTMMTVYIDRAKFSKLFLKK